MAPSLFRRLSRRNKKTDDSDSIASSSGSLSRKIKNQNGSKTASQALASNLPTVDESSDATAATPASAPAPESNTAPETEPALENPGQAANAVKETADQAAVTDPNEQGASDIVNGTGTVTSSLQRTAFLSRTDGDYNPVGNVEPPPKEQDSSGIATRDDVESVFAQFANLIHASNRPPPSETGDGSYLKKDEPSGLFSDLKSMGLKDLNTVRRIMEQKASGEPQDDRQYLMEAIMQLVSALPETSKNRVELTSQFLDELWNSLQHPPMSYMGEFKYRSADGSRNSYTFPELGKAGTPYARSVNPKVIVPGAKPDPFLVFDSVMARDKFIENPNRVSSIFFNWASCVIHDLFQTDHQDESISKTSSYLDLSILYGDNQEDQNMMRTFEGGKIKPDCFAEQRLLAFPPTAGCCIILLNRWHNYVVEQLAIINEDGRFTKPSDNLPEERKAAAWKKYDEDLFQTGRLITCSIYINITLYDYLRTIVNLNRTNSTWVLDPRMEKPGGLANSGTPRGVGNQVSAEFALCYRWHACVGELDEAWTEEVYMELFGKKPEEVDMKELMVGLAKYDHDLPEDPIERPFAHLKRGPDGKYDDEELANLMINGIEQVSGAFGARNTPKSMRAISVLGILQSRKWGLCTLNEFRAFFGLKKFETFEEINSDPEVAQALKNLYEHPDYVELYPGITVEDAKKPMVPGVGICPNHTIARAVLSDAVALVRGDRFYTIDYSPKHLTSWGWNEANFDLGINQGCVMYKLLLRALPNHFKPDSIYAHYPMTVPDENAKIMKDLGRFHDYNWEKPSYIEPRVNLTSYSNAKYLLERSSEFTVMWNDGLGYVMGAGGERFCLGGDTIFHKKQRETMKSLIYREKWHQHIKHYYEYITTRLIHEKSVQIAGLNQVDIIRDVNNLAHVHFASNMFSLPLKSEDNPKGIFAEQEMWMAMAVIFTAIFFDFEPTKSFPTRNVAKKLATMIGKLIEANVKTVTATGFAARFFDTGRENHNALADYGIHMIRQLAESGMSTYDMAFSQIMPTAIAMVPNQSQVVSLVVIFKKIANRYSFLKSLTFILEKVKLIGLKSRS